MPSLGTGTKINGFVYQYSSVTITIANLPYSGVTEINYSDDISRSKLMGTGIFPLGLTRGNYTAEGSITIVKEQFPKISAALSQQGGGRGFAEVSFLVTVTYAEPGSALITDTIEGCKIKHNENSHSSGSTDGLVHKFDLDVFRIKWNGLYAVGDDALAGLGGLLPSP